jgi:uncharacterized membrane protein
MAQAATRQRSAVRKRHAAHPNMPNAAAKPGTPSSASGGEHSTRREPSTRRRERRSGDGAVSGSEERSGEGESKLAAFVRDRKPELPGLGEISLPKPRLPKPHLSIWTRLVGKILKKVAKHELRRLTNGANWSLESVAGEELAEVKDKLGAVAPGIGMVKPQLPIQEAVDVAVPLEFAWSQWMELQFLPEGVDRVVEIERRDGVLTGQIEGGGDVGWSAEVLDERDGESFAWKSTEGSDCAGLLTFHSLSERLTRLELTLDVVPQDAAQSLLLLSHVAHRRARNELRRFKADLEVVSPDVYTGDEHSSSR